MEKAFISRRMFTRFLSVFCIFLAALLAISLPILSVGSRRVERQNLQLYQETIEHSQDHIDAQLGALCFQLEYFSISNPSFEKLCRKDRPLDYLLMGDARTQLERLLPDGERNAAGSIMMDAACDGLFGDEINILHGHHMKNRSMFGGLDFYREEAYYLEHPTIRLFTPNGDHEAAIFAAFTVDGEAFGYPTVFASDEAFAAFLEQAREKSAFQADVQVTRGDRLLILSTCAYSYETERLLVVAKIIE